MRIHLALAAVSALALSACGDSEVVADVNDEDSVAEASANLPNPEPGEYRTVGELVELTVPGAPEQEVEMVRGFMSAIFAEPQTQCITEEQAAEGYRDFVQGMGQSDDACELTRYETTSSTLSATMNCGDENGSAGVMNFEGEVSGTNMDMTMTMDGTDPNMGEMRMVIRMQSERVGECSAEAATAG